MDPRWIRPCTFHETICFHKDPAWIHDGPTMVPMQGFWRNHMFSFGPCLDPRWFRPCTFHETIYFHWDPAWIHDGSTMVPMLGSDAAPCKIAAAALSGTENAIETNFRTCLIQTGANCWFRFDARRRRARGHGDDDDVGDDGGRHSSTAASGPLIILITRGPPVPWRGGRDWPWAPSN